jgi:hypothetical protein
MAYSVARFDDTGMYVDTHSNAELECNRRNR